MDNDTALNARSRGEGTERENGAPLSIQARMATLVRLWSDAASVKAEAMDDTFEGKWIDREMQLATNRRMFFLVSLALLPPFFFVSLPAATSRFSPSVIILGTVLAMAFLVAVLGRRVAEAFCLRLAYLCRVGFDWKSWSVPLAEEAVRDLVRGALAGEAAKSTTRWLGFWRGWALFSPFYYRFVWWWILLFGLCSVQVEHAEYMGRGSLPMSIESRLIAELAISLLKVLIVSVIAFIATNVLREVLMLRERYSANLSQAQQLSTRLSFLGTSIERIQPLGTQMYEVLTRCVRVLGLSTRLAEFTKRVEGRSSQEQHASEKFLETIGIQVENFLDQITKAEDERAKLLVLGVLNGFLELQRQLLNTSQRRIMARFSDLALLGKELVDVSFPEGADGPGAIEFYGLMVLPPQRFLNNGRGQQIRGAATEIVGDSNWEAYLEGNRCSTRRGVRQTRFFLSVNGDSSISEARDIKVDHVQNSLSRWVEMDEYGRPRKAPNDAGDMRYVIEREREEEGTWMRLADVLGSIYHAPGCCKIREFSVDEFQEELVDRKRQKPLDYFAVRHSNEWIFCLQTLYDKDLDAADIELFYADSRSPQYQANWEHLKEKLNMIFFNEGNRGAIYRIEEYASKRSAH